MWQVALGLSKDLLQRAASVTLKERRPLVVAVRETPLSGQTLKQMVALDEAGAVVLPASPAFYAGATHIQDLVDFVAGRVLDAAGVEHRLYRRWEESSVAAPAARLSEGSARRTERTERTRSGSALLGGARGAGLVHAVRGGGLVGTRAVGQVLQLAHPGVGHLDRVHGEVHS